MTEMAQRVVKESYNTAGCVVVGVICMLMGMIFLVVLGVREVRPFLNDFRLETVQCKVFSSGYTDMKRRCTYHNFFHSSYPCFQIRVSYFAGTKRQTGYLYQSVHQDKNKVNALLCICSREVSAGNRTCIQESRFIFF